MRATLQTLGERISGGEARDVAEQLPPELRPWLQNPSKPEPFDLDEFLRRVAEREGRPPTAAERDVRGVFAALGRAVSRDELADMASELPKDFAPLIGAAASAEAPEPPEWAVWDVEEFLAGVAERAGLDREGAWRATEAALETLAERISGGEVEDVEAQLPAELRPALERGNIESHGAARRMSLEDFVRRIAEREGVTPDQALEHARAVFATLREAISEKELADIRAQLPDEYIAALGRP